MQREGNAIRLSASDLNRFAGCTHASRLDLARLHGEGPQPAEDSEDAALLQRHGDAHEAAYLARLRAEGGVVEISRDLPFEAAVTETRIALASGARVIFQGALEGGAWGGWSDFLERAETPSALGDYSYEVVDTKLKRKPSPSHVLQLVLYSDMLASLQERAPERAHVLLGDGSRFSFRLDEFADYARAARERLERFAAAPWETRPVPNSGCGLCRWREHCASVWETEDSLFRIAGISKSQVAKIEAAGVTTMAGLAGHDGAVPRLADPTLARLRMQARRQTARARKGPHFELREMEAGKGFDILPRPDPGDLFYDIEGDPFFSENGQDGLEYLHGVWASGAFTAFWAHDRAGERAALAALFEMFEARLSAAPGAHVYHYAAYEITALRRLVMRHGHGEERLDRWLSEGRFVDLYSVVRNGLVASEPSYSIKDLETLYGFTRTGEVKTAGGSVVAYETWRESGDRAILDEIEHYNQLDCISTEELRDWLFAIRPTPAPPSPPSPSAPDPAGEEAAVAREAEIARLREWLLSAGLPDGRGQLLFDLSRYHPREKKPAAWAVYDAAGKDAGDLCEDPDSLGGLVGIGPVERVTTKSVARLYRWPPQETKLRAGQSASIAVPGEEFPVSVSITALDRAARTVTVKTTRGDLLADRLNLLPDWAIGTKPIEGAIAAIIKDQLGPRVNSAAEDLLSRRPPRLREGARLSDLTGGDAVAAMIDSVGMLDGGVLPVQGPPGTGKTFVTARAILSLVRQGKRVGVCSNSHEAIRNVLIGCIDALEDDDAGLSVADVSLAHKGKDGMEPLVMPYDAIRMAKSAADTGGFDVVGGTAWLFSSEELAGSFDTIFVDEAGQVPLANALAITRAARNLVLVGDPNQLPQVVQGAHPTPADLSCLQWMIGDAQVMPPDHGLFLPITRRMHPDLCSYISRQFYARALDAHPDTGRQRVAAAGLPAAGAWRIFVDHEGHAQHAPEEIAAIRAAVGRLLRGEMTDRDARTREIRAADIIVVAPYNVQVNALAEALPGIRVGTVDRFQGQEAQVVLVSMTASSAEETPRGIDFLLSRQRMNVAISRGKALSLVFASPRLMETACTTVEQMRLVNALCALPEWTPDHLPRRRAANEAAHA